MATDWLHQGASYEEQGVESSVTDDDDSNSYDDVVLEKVDAQIPETTANKGKSIVIIVGVVVGLILILSLVVFAVIKKNTNKPQEVAEEITDIVGTDDSDEWVSAPTSFYTSEDRELLRKWGFSGDEIQSYEEQQVPASDLIEKTKKDQIAAQQEVLDALDDKKSKAYKKLISNTWLELPLNDNTFSSDPSEYMAFEAVDNADYVKVPARGNQFWLRVTLSDKTVIFMSVSPFDYAAKEKKGNINIRYRYFSCNDVKYIASIEEIQIE